MGLDDAAAEGREVGRDVGRDVGIEAAGLEVGLEVGRKDAVAAASANTMTHTRIWQRGPVLQLYFGGDLVLVR